MSKKVAMRKKCKTISKRVMADLLALAVAISGMGFSIARDSNTAKAAGYSDTSLASYNAFSVGSAVPKNGLEVGSAFDRSEFTKTYSAGTTASYDGGAGEYSILSMPRATSTASNYAFYAVTVITDANDVPVYAEDMVYSGGNPIYTVYGKTVLYGSLPASIKDQWNVTQEDSHYSGCDPVSIPIFYSRFYLESPYKTDYNVYLYTYELTSGYDSYLEMGPAQIRNMCHECKFNWTNMLQEQNGYYYMDFGNGGEIYGSQTTSNLLSNRTKDGNELFTLSGYTFKGWKKSDGSNVSTDDLLYAKNQCYYANFVAKIPQLNLTVNNDYNSKTQTVTLSASDDASGFQYYFGKEYTPTTYEGTCGSESFSTTKTISSSGTYYFVIKDAEGNINRKSVTCYDVTLNPNGGSTTFAGTNYSSNFVVTRAEGYAISLPTASKSGYSFQSWGGKTGTYTVTGNTTLTALYKDSKAPTPSITKTESSGLTQNITLSATDNEGITGYYFGTSSSPSYSPVSSTKNWSHPTSINAAGTYYLFTKDATGNVNSTSITCYAVTMNPNGGSTTFGGASYNSSFTAVRASGESITLPSATKSGYRFTGWSGKTGTYTVGSTTTLTAGYVDSEQSTASITVNGTSDRTQSLTLSGTDNEGITAYYFGTNSSPSAGSYTSVSSTKNWSKTTTVSAAGTYYLYTKDAAGNVSTAKSITCYKVDLNPNGGTSSYNGTSYSQTFSFIKAGGTLINLPSAKRNGYTFGGWSGYTSVYTVNANATLSAAWTPVKYNISYDLDGGKLTKTNPSVYTIETDSFTLNNPERDGYSFDGWTGSNGESASKEVTVAKGTTGNLSFTAKWTHLYDYNTDTKSLVLYSGSDKAIADVISKHPEVESITIEAGVDAGMIDFSTFEALKSISVSAGNTGYVSENGILYNADRKMLYCPIAHEDNPSISKKCTEIAENAFKNSTITTLNVPYSVKKIRSGAFENCTKLAEITIKNPSCVMEEGTIPSMIKTVYGFEDSLAIQYCVENDVPYKVITTLSNEFFANEVTMDSFRIPDNITDIEQSAFSGCKNLTEISLGTVSSIGAEAFAGTALESITIPKETKTIGAYAFADVTSLKTLEWKKDSSLTAIGAYAFARTSIANEENSGVVSLPETVESVAEGAFNKCDAIKKIRVNSMTTELAWSDTVLTLPKTVVIECYYGSKAYEYATSHDYPISLLVGYEADNTEKYVSGDTENLVSVSFGPVIKGIGENAFCGAENLTEVSFDEKSVLETIGDKAFSETGLTEISLPESVTTLGTGVFKDSAALETASLGGVTVVPAETFSGCSTLTNVTETENWTSLGDNAFCGTGVTEFKAGKAMTKFGKNVFADSALSKLIVENPNCIFPNEGGLVPEGAVIKGYQNSSADVYSQTYYDSACEGFGKPAYIISFDMTGGKNGTEKLYVVNGDKIPSIKVPEREDYNFAGYYVQENGRGTKYFDAEGNSVKDWDSTTNITLYAAWNHQTYTVVYDGNGATGGTMENSVFDTNTETTLAKNTYEKTGNRFLGWSTDKNATVAEYDNKETIDALGAVGETITLYAVWESSYYTVKFNSNDNTGTTLEQTMELDATSALKPNEFIRENYTFLGWSKNSSATTPDYIDKANVKNLAKSGGTITLYAVWAEGAIPEHTIRYDANSGEMNPVTDTFFEGYGIGITSEKPVRKGFVFVGWTTVKGSSQVEYTENDTLDTNTDVVLYAVWATKGTREYTIVTYTQKADGSYGSTERTMSADADAEVTLAPGCDFVVPDSYYVDANQSKLTNTIGENTIFVIYLNRMKTKVNYNVNAEDAHMEEVTQAGALWGSTVTLDAPMPEREGYLFVGWGETSTSEEPVTEVVLGAEGTTVYAIWKRDTAVPTAAPTITPTVVPTGAPSTEPTATATATAIATMEPTPTATATTPGEEDSNKIIVTPLPTDKPSTIPDEIKASGYSLSETNTSANKKTVDKVTYQVTGSYATVAKVSANAKSVSVSKTVTINGKKYKVKRIAKNAFKGMKNLKKVTIHSPYLTKIGKNAFKGVNKKAKIIVPRKQYKKYKKMIMKKGTGYLKTMSIKKKAVKVLYQKTGSYATVTKKSTASKLVAINGIKTINGKKYKVKAIAKNAFKGMKNLKKVIIQSPYLNKIGKNALKGIRKDAVIVVPKKQYEKYKKLIMKKSVGWKNTMKVVK